MNYYFISNNKELFTNLQTATIKEAYEYLKDKKEISLDIETTRKFSGSVNIELEGLDPYLSQIVMFQIGDLEKQFIIDYRNIKLGILREILLDKDKLFIGQNIKFEYKHILHNEGIRLNNVYDTMIAEKILYNGLNPEVSLKVLNKKYLNIEVDKETRLEFLTIGSKPFTENQIKYGAEDIYYPILIREKQLEELRKKDLLVTLKLEMKFLRVLGDIEYKGIHFNKERWLDNYNNNLNKYQELEEELNNIVIKNYFNTDFISKQLNLFDSELSCNISWTSSKQVIDFFRYLNICPKEVSKTTKQLSYTVNANVVKSSLNTINKNISEDLKILINKYLEFKELEQACTTFGKDFLKYINPITKRIHSNYNQIMNTGRISSSNPNLQNIPADEEFRKCFDVQKGFKIINADYSGQEQIILANVSEDKDLINFYESGLGDMHSFIASKIFPHLNTKSLEEIKNNFKKERQIAKAAGFAINYGGNGFTISKNLGIPENEGEEVYTAYFRAFPGLNEYFTRVKRETLLKGFILIDKVTKRKTYFYKPRDSKEIGAIHRKALNFPIQGAAGSITKLATILVREEILNRKLEDKIFITNIVHDEINLEAQEEYASEAAKILKTAMEKAGEPWCKIVKLKADAVITDYWSH